MGFSERLEGEKATTVDADVGREVNAIVMRCPEKDLAARYAAAGALLQSRWRSATQTENLRSGMQ